MGMIYDRSARKEVILCSLNLVTLYGVNLDGYNSGRVVTIKMQCLIVAVVVS